MGITDNPNDPGVAKYRGKDHDDEPVPQQDAYLVLSDHERGLGFVRPFRHAYKHKTCGAITTRA